MRHLSVVFVLASAASACNTDDSGGGGDLVDGSIVLVGTGVAPASAYTMVGWLGNMGMGDYLYRYGGGEAFATGFSADVSLPLPLEAMQVDERVAVGLVILMPDSYPVPDGVVGNSDALWAAKLGLAGQYSIIYRETTTPVPYATWFEDFPVGLSCGKCVQHPQELDTFAPVPCDQMEMQVGPDTDIQVCNFF